MWREPHFHRAARFPQFAAGLLRFRHKTKEHGSHIWCDTGAPRPERGSSRSEPSRRGGAGLSRNAKRKPWDKVPTCSPGDTCDRETRQKESTSKSSNLTPTSCGLRRLGGCCLWRWVMSSVQDGGWALVQRGQVVRHRPSLSTSAIESVSTRPPFLSNPFSQSLAALPGPPGPTGMATGCFFSSSHPLTDFGHFLHLQHV